jgi:glycine cleavage system H protein
MEYPEALLYTKDHEWIRQEADVATVGISDHAQQELGDVVYVEIPRKNEEIERGASMASVESVKAVSDVYSPVTGRIEDANEDLVDHPEKINEDPYGAGWIAKIRLSESGPLKGLMTAPEYEAYVEEESSN